MLLTFVAVHRWKVCLVVAMITVFPVQMLRDLPAAEPAKLNSENCYSIIIQMLAQYAALLNLPFWKPHI